MSDLEDFARIARADQGLCVLTTSRADTTIQASVVNAGVLERPGAGGLVVGLVARGGSRKLANLRRRRRVTIVAKTGWEWAAVEGDAELLGPDDPNSNVGPDDLRRLLRAVFRAAGGSHDDWDEYDRMMAADRRTVVFIEPVRVYSNG